MNADHVYSQDRIIASLRLELKESKKLQNKTVLRVAAEKKRGDLLQAEIDSIDDFYAEHLKEHNIKLNRSKH